MTQVRIIIYILTIKDKPLQRTLYYFPKWPYLYRLLDVKFVIYSTAMNFFLFLKQQKIGLSESTEGYTGDAGYAEHPRRGWVRCERLRARKTRNRWSLSVGQETLLRGWTLRGGSRKYGQRHNCPRRIRTSLRKLN